MKRIGIDVGGTFTDIVLLDEQTGATSWLKIPTNVTASCQGVLDAVAATGANYAEIEHVRLGTTLGVNAILTRTGARTGLITTDGFRDVLEIRRTHREQLFDLNERIPEPLVPRDLRLEVVERVDAEGNVVVPLDEAGVRRAWRTLKEAGVEALAIVFLFSFEKPAHERRAAEIVVDEGAPDALFISSDVLPTYREYERTSTTVTAAYIAGAVRRYLQELGEALEERGLAPGRLAIMTNSGGVLSPAAVARQPVSILLSGPAGGVEAARWLAERAGTRNVLTLDMGGTSCDVSGIVDGIPDERVDMVVEGLAVSYPTFDIKTIGAGGGSIAWIDPGEALRVGPQSAGSHPGPACYGHGGVEPTVTDANLVLGRYDEHAILGGSIRLDLGRAREAVGRIAEPLGLSIEEAAAGIVRIVNTHMMNAVRVISVERGRDVRDFALVAFGGAGATHAAEIARELSVPRVLVPPFPGCNSAFGAVISGSRHDYLRTVARIVGDIDLDRLLGLIDDLKRRALQALAGEGYSDDRFDLELWLDLRYEGQAHELSVQHDGMWVDSETLEAALQAFHAQHEQLYGHAFDDVPVELVNVRVKGFGRDPDARMWWNWRRTVEPGDALKPTRPIYFQEIDDFLEAQVLLREELDVGKPVQGPAVVHQVDSTIVVPPGFTLEPQATGALLLTYAGEHEPRARAAVTAGEER